MLLLLVACGGRPTTEPGSSPAAPPSPHPATTTPAPAEPSTSVTATTSPTAAPSPTEKDDPRWRFFTPDRKRYSSPWFEGRHRVMIGYGCTPAPYYDPDPACPDGQGFHHGIDVAMPCGTPLFSALDGIVLDPRSSGAPGAAYGERPFRIRTDTVDVLVGHARQVFVEPGDRVGTGQRIALASDSGAPDGCHLHFEVRRHGGGVSEAVDPAPLLHLVSETPAT